MTKLSKILVLACLTIVLSVFFLFFGLLLFFVLYPTKNTDSNPKPQILQYTNVIPSENIVSKGFLHAPMSLKQDEFMSYLNPETGTTTIITNSGGSNFECSGSCFCDSSNRRSTSSHILSRGLIILFSAFSVSMATKIAKQAFEEQCVLQYSSFCLMEDIRSEVDICEESRHEKVVGNENDELYHCHGYCLRLDDTERNFLGGSSKEEMEMAKSILQIGQERYGLCEGLTMEKDIYLYDDDFDYFQYKKEGVQEESEHLHLAALKFTTILNEFCVVSTRVKTSWMPQKHRNDVEESVSILEQILADENHHVFESIGRDQLESMFRSAKLMSDEGVPYCHGGRMKKSEMTESGQWDLGMGLDLGENVKCVKRTEKNPNWRDWGPKYDLERGDDVSMN